MDVLFFLVVLEVIGILSFPIAFPLARSLRDTGYSIARPLGIVMLSLGAWALASIRLLPFDQSIVVAFLGLAALAAISMRRYRGDIRLYRGIALYEGIFILTFLLATLVLAHKPEVYFAYSEDLMDAALLQSLLRTDYFPPADPWFAGSTLPYYYFGHMATAVLVRLSGVPVLVGYNLAVAALFAMGVQAAFGLGLNLTEKVLYGIAASVFTMVTGFLAGFVQLGAFAADLLVFRASSTSVPDWILSFDFNAGTTIIPHTLNFYPFFTFLQGDLHAHYVVIPFQLAFIGLCIAVSRAFSRTAFASALLISFFLAGTNIWSFPASLALLALAAYMGTGKRAFLAVIAAIGLLFLGSWQAGLIGAVDPAYRTDLAGFFLVFGAFAFVSVAYLLGTRLPLRWAALVAAIALLTAGAGFLAGFQLAFLLILAVPFLFIALSDREFPALLAGTALLLIVFSEIFFVQDAYGPPLERMNTVMKLHLQAWVFWGIASAFFLSRIRSRLLVAGVILLVAAAVLHPALTLASITDADMMGTTRTLTLDGAAWLEEQKPDEYAALVWLRETAADGEVVLEAPGDAYAYSSRVPAFTGLPTVIGWRTHEVMWGRGWDEVDGRYADVERIYTETTPALLDRYHVRYILVGEPEIARYGTEPGGLADSDGVEVAYRSGETRVYRVRSPT